MNQQKNQQKNQTKQNYQNLRPHHRGTAAATACSDIIAAQLLCSMQQLCTGVSVGVFSNYGVILQPEYLSG